tara:strand:+ start:1320 stop:2030 length:711 start_codon:yes stop_codon:yes gene_type:complete
MNLGCKEGAILANKFTKILKKNTDTDFIILPSLQSIFYIKHKLKNNSINIGAQNCSQYSIGAYTGDVSAAMIKELGCKYVLLGHSERRSLYKEDKKELSLKVINAIKNNLKIIFCVGESLSDYKKRNTKKIITMQLTGMFNKNVNFRNVVIAYEPVWAIGTNKTPSLEEIEFVHSHIKNFFKIKYAVKNICVIYGGSVNLNNSKEIFSTNNVDGGLIGGASLKANEFKKIYDNLNN